jgi:periplasmic mercuric ion binding protein
MKTKFIYIITIFLLVSSGSVFAQKAVKANLKVYGNCVMCKQRIETALDQNGIKMAQWDPKSKNLEIVYNSHKISEQKIHEIIAAAGHDTEKVKAKDEVYAKLPFCCLYRDHEMQDDHTGHRK